MTPFTKRFLGIVSSNLKFGVGPDEYTLFQSKHISNDALEAKYAELEAFAMKTHGEIRRLNGPQIRNDMLCLDVYLVGDVVAMKELDTKLEQKTLENIPLKADVAYVCVCGNDTFRIGDIVYLDYYDKKLTSPGNGWIEAEDVAIAIAGAKFAECEDVAVVREGKRSWLQKVKLPNTD